MWEITNPDEFQAQDGGYVKPILKQKGPYSYKHKYKKSNIVRVKQIIFFEFSRSRLG